jgi:energy-coupling factor transporter ATP-binding protein EcfA2
MSFVNFLYNPDRKDKDQLISEFVVRNKILGDIMSDLESSEMKTPEQHYLLVGQRGAGKSTLLNRIKYAVEDSAKLKPILIPILFGEEQYNVGELANLWENVAQVLEDYHGFDGIYDEMEHHVHESDFEEKCWDILESALDGKNKKLLLLIDNVGDMFIKIEELQVRRLRELLQTKPCIRLIAGSPFYLESLLDYKQSFFEFFKVVRLDELTSDETISLLLKLGEIHNEKDKIEKIIKESPGRVESLRTLAGGVPRTIALMFNIFIEHENESSLKDLDKILDNVTPFYKHRMDDLPTQQQKIVDAVAKNWDPIGVKDLKDRVRLEGKIISAQLRQLEKNQVVSKQHTVTKNHLYLLKERFFNIWYLMRYGRKDDKQRVLWLVRFLESWCTDEEIENRINEFIKKTKLKQINETEKDFFAETYASLTKLKTNYKILLRESFPQTGRNIQFTNEEIDKIVEEKLDQQDFEIAIDLLSNKKDLTTENKISVMKAQSDAKSSEEIRSLAKKVLFDRIDQNKPILAACQIWLNSFGIYAATRIQYMIEKGAFEGASQLLRLELGAMVLMMQMIKDFEYFSDIKLELLLLASSIRDMYLGGQYDSLVKIFEESEIDNETGILKYSEIFNPIYLALLSLNPEGKIVNIASEKMVIVQQIVETITKK